MGYLCCNTRESSTKSQTRLVLVILMILLGLSANGVRGGATTTVCSLCDCTAVMVNCKSQHLNETYEDPFYWSDVSNQTIGDFDNNHIGVILPFPFLPFRELRLRYNRIVKIADQAFKNLTSLTSLDLSHNQLTSVNMSPKIFEGGYDPMLYEPLAYLESLDLSSNDLHTLDSNIFEHVPKIKKLYLATNGFKVLDKQTEMAISSLSNLEVLDLSNNNLKELPDYILHTPKLLQQLILNGNRLTMIPDVALANSHNLTHLSLNENPISAIPSARPFPNLPSLKQLHISFMPELTRIEDYSMGGLSSLEFLDCQSNEFLEYISPNALRTRPTNDSEGGTWPPLKTLFINDNAIIYLDSGLVGRWDQLQHLDIRGNEWSCDCENQWLIETLMEEMIQIQHSNLGGLKCAAPEEMRGASFLTLHKRNYTMRCLDYYGAQPSNDSTILVSVFAIIIVAMVIVGGVMWIRNNRGYLRQGGPVRYDRAFYKPTEVEDYERHV